ncbi:MAG: hypothetical protein WC712_13110, partial [Candidatus Brocadiia bacterium]
PRADEPSAEAQALAICRAFGIASVAFSNTSEAQTFWGSGTTNFAPDFMHVSPKDGYTYRYFSNSSAPDRNDATKFVYLAVPENLKAGKRAFFLDEARTRFEAGLATDEQVQILRNLRPVGINWSLDDHKRVGVLGIEFFDLELRTSNEASAKAICISFGSLSAEYIQTKAAKGFWGSGTTDFTPLFAHEPQKGGYRFQYFSNSSEPTANDATKFVYLAVPLSIATGVRAFYVDESQTIYESSLTSGVQNSDLLDFKPSGVRWDLDDNKRISIAEVNFVPCIKENVDRESDSEYAAWLTCARFCFASQKFGHYRVNSNYWGSGTTDFTPYFTHISPKGGYAFAYFSNSSAPGTDDATKFVYLAYPEALKTGKRAFYLDETQEMYEGSLATEEQVRSLLGFKPAGVKWALDGNKRLDVPGVEFVGSAKQSASLLKARETCWNFSEAAFLFSRGRADKSYWSSVTTDFGPRFTHIPSGDGYTYRYFSNSTAPNVHDASKFVYLAIPDSRCTGKRAIYADESPIVSEAAVTSDEQCRALRDFKLSDVNWTLNNKRIEIPGVAFDSPDRRTINMTSAYLTCVLFGSAALEYSKTRANHAFRGSGTQDFSPQFAHTTPKGGYVFAYFSNSSAPDKDDATKFVYLAFPVGRTTGDTAFFIFESQVVSSVYLPNDAKYRALRDFKSSDIRWERADITRLQIPGQTNLGR